MKKRLRIVITIASMLFLVMISVQAIRLPVPGGDDDNWGGILNEFLLVSLNNEGNMKENTIGTTQIKDTAVIGAKIATSTITGLHIQNNAITTDHIADSTIKNSDIAADAQIALSKLEPITWSMFSSVLPTSQGGLGAALSGIQKGDLLIGSAPNQFTNAHVGTVNQVLLGGPTPNWGSIQSDHIANNAITTNHILDSTLTGNDFNTLSDLKVNTLTANAINAPIHITLNIETVSSSCQGRGCTTTATCPAGKVIISGMKSDYYTLCDGSSYTSYCRGFCKPGVTSCSTSSIISTTGTLYGASVYITCISAS